MLTLLLAVGAMCLGSCSVTLAQLTGCAQDSVGTGCGGHAAAESGAADDRSGIYTVTATCAVIE